MYFGEHNVKGMFSVLEPLHNKMEQGPETLKEISFNHVRLTCHSPHLPHPFLQCTLTDLPFPLLFCLHLWLDSSNSLYSYMTVCSLCSLHFITPPSPQAYGRDLAEAYEWCKKFQSTSNVKELTQAWELYYHVFRRISKQLPQVRGRERDRVLG